MASVPISQAYVQRLTRETERKLTNRDMQIQIEKHVKKPPKCFFRSVCFLGKISATCQDQMVAIYIDLNVTKT